MTLTPALHALIAKCDAVRERDVADHKAGGVGDCSLCAMQLTADHKVVKAMAEAVLAAEACRIGRTVSIAGDDEDGLATAIRDVNLMRDNLNAKLAALAAALGAQG
jgi:hypothetical protein